MGPEKTYTVKVTRDPAGGWLAEVEDLEGVRTSARTLESLSDRVLEAISSSGAPKAKLGYVWPTEIIRQIIPVDTARAKARHAQEAALLRTIESARELKKLGLSLRDAAHLLEISHQRVQQLLNWKD